MERATIKLAKDIMGSNFIGPDELGKINLQMGITIPKNIPSIPYSSKELIDRKNRYLLILGLPHTPAGDLINLSTLRNKFGVNPDIFEPCFYNQDWYINERFFYEPISFEWFMIRKNVISCTRSKDPYGISISNLFPSAIQCAYAFFVCWFHLGEILWKNDFIWCKDKDHNGDLVYVGKYHDINFINKNGFSIHRLLAIREFYGAVSAY
jgi:hypothetical protein